MKNAKRVVQIMALALASGAIGVANATVNYQIGNGGLGTFSGVIDGVAINGALAGGIKITEQGTPVSGLPTSYVTVCTDLQGTLYLGQTYTYNTPATSFSSSPIGLQPKWSNPGQAIQNAAYLFYTYGTSGGTLAGSAGISGSTDQLEALQLAIWAALYDTTSTGSVNLTGGRFTIIQNSVDSTVWADVNKWLGLSGGAALAGNYGYDGYLFQPTSGAANNQNADGQLPQELLFGVGPGTSGGPVPVPESSTVLAGALLVLPLAASTIRIIRRKQNA